MINICYEACKVCNLHCDYCISSDNESSENQNFEDIVKEIAQFEPKRIVVSGGEPLLDPTLKDKLGLIRQLCPDAFVSLSSNGSIAYDLSSLNEYINCIDISLPALDPDIYKDMRGKDLVSCVIENIKQAKRASLDTRISYILTKMNKGELSRILDFAQENEISSVRIGRFLPLREAKCVKDKYELTQEEIDKIMDEVMKKAYPFELIPPISELSGIEQSYLTVDFSGKFFLPTGSGKNYLKLDEVTSKVGNQLDVFKRVKLQDAYECFFRPIRTRASDGSRILVDEYYSDRTRILYFPYFRRMQQKAQVFSLEKNPSVRSRLTHSIEVSDIGRRLALQISDQLTRHEHYKLAKDYCESLISIVENACLLHDIGNPPFGHFGEAAIKKWWAESYENYIEEYNKRARKNEEKSIAFSDKDSRILLKDFEEFDGNPQGVRAVLRLCADKDDSNAEFQSGLNLTYPTILCVVKYARAAGEQRNGLDKNILKKAGYFQSEKNILDKIYKDMGMWQTRQRYPFTYIMETADDIAYGISDIADGIEKKILTLQEVVAEFENIWLEKGYGECSLLPEDIIHIIKDRNANKLKKDFNNLLGTAWKKLLIESVADEFVQNIAEYLKGTTGAILEQENPSLDDAKKVLNTLKEISRVYIYRSPEAEAIEMSGYAIISGLLEYFGQLLRLTYNEFTQLVEPKTPPSNMGLDLEWRIFNRLSHTCVLSYKRQLSELKEYYKDDVDAYEVEWWLRVHLILDHIAGMTDDFALKTYQVCKGIDIAVF